MHHAPMASQYIYGCSDEDWDGKEGSKIPGGGERVEESCWKVL